MVLGTVKLKQRQYRIAFNAWKRCRKRVDGLEEHHEGIHDRFLRDPVYRDSQLKIVWTEQKCIEMDKLAQEDHFYRLSRDEFQRDRKQWCLTLNKSGKNAPMRLRSDFGAAVSLKNRLQRESREERAEHIPFQQYQRWHPSSSSDSWWNWRHVQKLVELTSSIFFEICCNSFGLQLIAICCNRRAM